jgi:hypothetical protein
MQRGPLRPESAKRAASLFIDRRISRMANRQSLQILCAASLFPRATGDMLTAARLPIQKLEGVDR